MFGSGGSSSSGRASPSFIAKTNLSLIARCNPVTAVSSPRAAVISRVLITADDVDSHLALNTATRPREEVNDATSENPVQVKKTGPVSKMYEKF